MSETIKKYLTLIGYLTISNGLGYFAATYLADDPALTSIFGPSINLIIYLINKELSKEGVIRGALKK